MGRIAKVVSFLKRSIVADPGGGSNITANHFSPPGDDSQPLPDDYCVVSKSAKTGGGTVAGYYDAENLPKAGPGEKRIYARDSTGVLIVEVWLKSDGEAVILNGNGSITLSPGGDVKGLNGSGSFELQASGDFVVNGVTIDPAGNITTPAVITSTGVIANTSLTVGGVEMSGHTHSQGVDSNGDTQQTTGAPA